MGGCTERHARTRLVDVPPRGGSCGMPRSDSGCRSPITWSLSLSSHPPSGISRAECRACCVLWSAGRSRGLACDNVHSYTLILPNGTKHRGGGLGASELGEISRALLGGGGSTLGVLWEVASISSVHATTRPYAADHEHTSTRSNAGTSSARDRTATRAGARTATGWSHPDQRFCRQPVCPLLHPPTPPTTKRPL